MFLDYPDTSRLYDVCIEYCNNLKNYRNGLEELYSVFEECKMLLPPSPVIKHEDIFIEHEGTVERCIHELSGYLHDISYLFYSIHDYINQCITTADKEKQLNYIIDKTTQLISDLSNRFPSSKDTEYLKQMLIGCINEFDYWCQQKWPDGKSRISIDAIDYLMNQYEVALASTVGKLKDSLERYRLELERYRSKLESYRSAAEKSEPIITMECVYASPEIMKRKYNEIFSPVEERSYPSMHAFVSDAEEDCFMEELPQMMLDYQNDLKKSIPKNEKTTAFCMYCGNPIENRNHTCFICGKLNTVTDPEITIQFCPKCSNPIPMIAQYCTFCGNNTRENFVSEDSIAPMTYVYASPEAIKTNTKKKGFFKKLFKRFDI